MKYIDSILNTITMYRLVLYGLLCLASISIIFGFIGLLPYSGISFVYSLGILFMTSYGINRLLGAVFNAPLNAESSAITALILFLILTPVQTLPDALSIFAIAAIAQVSKYIFTYHHKHLFNPVASALVIAGLWSSVFATWWIGSTLFLPIVTILGLLIVRKIRRGRLVTAFFVTTGITLLLFSVKNGIALNSLVEQVFLPMLLSTPLVFFATIMLTEPTTTPPTKKLHIIYGALVGFLYASQWNITLAGIPFYPTPELSLIIGNIFAYMVSSKEKLQLTIVQKNKLSEQIYEFVFSTTRTLRFTAGQYLEWTLPHTKNDDRGVRRYFTIASAPTEKELRLTVRTFPKSSTFKNTLTQLQPGDHITVSSLSGDFVLPQDPQTPLVLIAGGIGITPFRSQIKWLLDTNQKRSITLFYNSNTPQDLVFMDIFTEAQRIGLITIPIISDPKNAPADWHGETGFITPELIKKYIPDTQQPQWYLSGPNVMVENYKKMLKHMGVSHKNIITDYFPGF